MLKEVLERTRTLRLPTYACMRLLVYEALRGTYADVATTNISASHPPPLCVLTTRRSDVTNRCQCDGCSRPFSNRPSTTITVGRPSAHAISQTDDGSTQTATCATRRRRAHCVSALLRTYRRDGLKKAHAKLLRKASSYLLRLH